MNQDFREFATANGAATMIYPPNAEQLFEHQANIGSGHCNDSKFGCEVVMALRAVFGNRRWPSKG